MGGGDRGGIGGIGGIGLGADVGGPGSIVAGLR